MISWEVALCAALCGRGGIALAVADSCRGVTVFVVDWLYGVVTLQCYSSSIGHRSGTVVVVVVVGVVVVAIVVVGRMLR